MLLPTFAAMRNSLLCGFVAVSLGGCGAPTTTTPVDGTAGAAHGGGSSAGASAGGSSSSGSAGLGGSSGTRDQGTGGSYEICIVCGGAFGFAGSGASSGATAPGGAGGTGGTGGVRCGDVSCAPNQYCRAPCTGFGGAMGEPRCADLPAACDGVQSCTCICGVTSHFCTPGAAEVQCGCG